MESQKITESLGKGRRWYQDACGTALAMDLVGERWSMLIVRELLLGPRRFGEIRSALQGLSANILTQRLESLEKDGILEKKLLPSPANAHVYALTRWGSALEDPILALSRWAAGSPQHDVTLTLSSTAFMLSLRTMLDTEKAQGLDIDLGFVVAGDAFRARIAERLEIERRAVAGAELVFEGPPSTLAATFYGRDAVAESQRLGRVAVTGDLDLAQRFVDCFALPRFVG